MPKLAADSALICTLAIRHLGQSKGIVSLDTDKSEAAEACRAFYPVVLDEVLRDFPWSFATQFVALALVAGPVPTATLEWTYSYRIPSDCVRFRRIVPGTSRIDTHATRIPHRIVSDANGGLLLTDYPPLAATATTRAVPQGEYVAQADDPTQYPADFVQLLALKLAGYLAPTLTAGDRFKLGMRALQLYEVQRRVAQDNSANEQQPDPESESEYILARE